MYHAVWHVVVVVVVVVVGNRVLSAQLTAFVSSKMHCLLNNVNNMYKLHNSRMFLYSARCH